MSYTGNRRSTVYAAALILTTAAAVFALACGPNNPPLAFSEPLIEGYSDADPAPDSGSATGYADSGLPDSGAPIPDSGTVTPGDPLICNALNAGAKICLERGAPLVCRPVGKRWQWQRHGPRCGR